MVKFADNGLTVNFPDREKDPYWDEYGAPLDAMPEFQHRRPLLYDRNRNVYVGEPGWFHEDLYSHHQIPEENRGQYQEGYIGDRRNLIWYGGEPENHPQVAEALDQSGIKIRNSESQPHHLDAEPNWEDGWEDIGFHHSASKDFEHWWKTKGPSVAKASILAEYAAGEGLDRDEAKSYIDDHESEIRGDKGLFRRRFFRKFDALTR